VQDQRGGARPWMAGNVNDSKDDGKDDEHSPPIRRMSWQTVANAIKRPFHVPHTLFPVQPICRASWLKKQSNFPPFFFFLQPNMTPAKCNTNIILSVYIF